MNYSKETPFLSCLTHRYRLNEPLSTKETWHIAIDISNSGMDYKPGDSLGVIPKNPRSLVDRVIRYSNLAADSTIEDPRNGSCYTFFQWLHERVDISILSEKLFLAALEHARSSLEAKKVQEIVELYTRELPEKVDRREYSWFRGIDVPTFFEKYLPSGVHSFSQLFSSFTPIIPRFYSIASSPLMARDSIELLVNRVAYSTGHGTRVGIASHYLAYECPTNAREVQVFLQPTKHFVLPEDVLKKEKPLVMIGPGTGVAPFRSFLQHAEMVDKERNIHPLFPSHEKGRPNLWLIFGERHREHDFLYKDYWESLVQRDVISFDAVFSRDGLEKEYVQHRMWAKRKELFRWIHHEEGYLYVCGDAKKMAKDVESMLIKIVHDEGNMSHDQAEEWLKMFRKSGRYRRDVY